MVFNKEQYQEYYQKIKEERNRKRREKYLSKKWVDENPSRQVDEKLLNEVDEIGLTKELSKKVDETFLNRVDENISKVDEKRVDDLKVDEKLSEVDENRQPKLRVDEKLSEVELFNEQVYQRAKTRDPKRFFTFPDGRKIARTKCGCNPTKDFYDWCLDDCPYFTNWRNT